MQSFFHFPSLFFFGRIFTVFNLGLLGCKLFVGDLLGTCESNCLRYIFLFSIRHQLCPVYPVSCILHSAFFSLSAIPFPLCALHFRLKIQFGYATALILHMVCVLAPWNVLRHATIYAHSLYVCPGVCLLSTHENTCKQCTALANSLSLFLLGVEMLLQHIL